jgi:hypothetical protein
VFIARKALKSILDCPDGAASERHIRTTTSCTVLRGRRPGADGCGVTIHMSRRSVWTVGVLVSLQDGAGVPNIFVEARRLIRRSGSAQRMTGLGILAGGAGFSGWSQATEDGPGRVDPWDRDSTTFFCAPGRAMFDFIRARLAGCSTAALNTHTRIFEYTLASTNLHTQQIAV